MGEKGVWCGICAKYLAFSTYPTSTVGALRKYDEALELFREMEAKNLMLNPIVYTCKLLNSQPHPFL